MKSLFALSGSSKDYPAIFIPFREEVNIVLGTASFPIILRRVVIYSASFILVTSLGATILAILGKEFTTYPRALLESTTTSQIDIVKYATPLILSSLAVAIAGQAGLLNIGVEGQLNFGAFTAAIVGHAYGFFFTSMPALHLSLVLIVSITSAGLIAAAAGVVKSRFRIHEVLFTLFSYFMIMALLNFLLTNKQIIADPALGAQTREVVSSLQLRSPFIGIIAAAVATAGIWVVVYHTYAGLLIRGLGENLEACKRLGFNIERSWFWILFVSGGLAGLVGVIRVLTQDHRYIVGFSPGYGFIGLGIAFAAGNRPIDIFFLSLLFATVQSAGGTLQLTAAVPMEFVDLIQGGLLITLVLLTYLFDRWWSLWKY